MTLTARHAHTSVLTNPATGVSIRILQSTQATHGRCLELEASYPPGSARPPMHLHPQQDEHFVILSGSMTAALAGQQRELRAGDELDIPAGTPHAMWNNGRDAAVVRWTTTPALRTEDMFRDAYWLAAQGRVDAHGTPGLIDLAWFVPRYWNEIRAPRPPALVQRMAFALLAPLAMFRTRRR